MKLLKEALDVLIGIYYNNDLNNQGIYTAVNIFEELLNSEYDMEDYKKKYTEYPILNDNCDPDYKD